MDTLVTSSPLTRQWLEKIESKLAETNPSFWFKKAKYWAALASPETRMNCVYLQPQVNQIRLFTRLEDFAIDLQPTPASLGWAQMYPMVFLIRSERQTDRAVELIIGSYQRDRWL